MGADAADINNDGLEEIYVTDMLPPDRERLKQTTGFDSYDYYNMKLSKGFYRQFMKNSLQLNQGNGRFSEIGRYSGVEATDWSWSTLIFDMDNDGYKELFVTNGIYKDLTDMDFITYLSDQSLVRNALYDSAVDFKPFVDRMPSTPLSNYAFTLDTLLKFKNVAAEWGLGTPSFSNGAAYGDLDNDGDLDLIVNNVNQKAFIYKNTSEKLANQFVKFELTGSGSNTKAVGAEIILYVGDERIAYHHYPTRGFQSSMDYGITIGLGQRTTIDSAVIRWDATRSTTMINPGINQRYQLNYSDSDVVRPGPVKVKDSRFKLTNFNHKHTENEFIDFNQERLLYHQLSREGPAVAIADLDGDGLDDFYLGGALGGYGIIYFNDGNDTYTAHLPELFKKARWSEDVDATFLDVDMDGDLDLYVVSGGNEHADGDGNYQDRLYLNEGLQNGKIIFSLNKGLPAMKYPGSCVKPTDFDGDGDLDLFVGSRSVPGKYGLPPDSYLLENDGKGNFKDVTSKYMSQLAKLGMVTDAVWVDYDRDEDPDLVIVGEWMPVVLLENRGNFFQRKFDFPGLERSQGLYSTVKAMDITRDGYPDLLLGNLGKNSMFRPTGENPIRLFVGDMDNNGSIEQVCAFLKNGKYYPYHIRNELNFQLSFVKKKFPLHKEYANRSMDEIFTEDQLHNSVQMTIYDLSSKVAINNDGSSFTMKKMPMQAQFSRLYEFVETNIDGGNTEIIALGNFFATRPEESIYDANHGLIMSVEGGALRVLPESVGIKGEVRGAGILRGKHSRKLLIAKNNDFVQIYSFK